MRRTVAISTAGCAALSGACSDDAGDVGTDRAPPASHVASVPDEITVNGHRYVREWMLSPADLAAMKDPELWKPPETVEKLAQLLRGYMSNIEYGEYVEAEPNYQLARVSLGLEPPGPEKGGNAPDQRDGIVEKSITSDGDQRSIVNTPSSNPSNAYSMCEAGGTGTMVGLRIYTAGHVIYNNAVVGGTDGWNCRDGTTSTGNPACAAAGHPRWRWGGKITYPGGVETPTFTTPWTLCGYKNAPAGWVNLPAGSSSTTLARWDYAYQNLDGCIPAGAGNVGWWTTDQAALRTFSLWQAGYPSLYTCPALALGGSQAAGDCPTNGFGQGVVQQRPNISTRPYTAGSLYWTSGTGPDPGLIVTGGYLKSSRIDITSGQSGGGVILFDPSDGGWWAVATTSNTAGGQSATWFNHLTVEVKDFLYQ